MDDNIVGFFYILNNKDWEYENKLKYGIATDYNKRFNTDQHSYRSEYVSIYKYEKIKNKYKLHYNNIDDIISKQRKNDKIEKLIKKKYPLESFENLFKIKKYLISHNGGTEFINKEGLKLLEDILLNDFNKIGIKVSIFPKEEWNIINSDSDSYNSDSDSYNSDSNSYNFDSDSYNFDSDSYNFDSDSYDTEMFKIELNINNNINNNIYENNLRDYQKKIKNEAFSNIIKDNKVYISLATGGGKTRISFEILNELSGNNSTIIIFTPRVNICQQNLNNKYLKLLTNSYKIYNKTNLKNISNNDNNLVCCCINSYKKVVKAIVNADLRNISIWFDEAHYGIDNLIINFNEEKEFLLKDDKYIKYRLFTSASPNKDFITKNNKIFGEFVNPIKIKYLMYEGYLCKKLNTYIYKDKIYEDVKDNKSFVNFIINNHNNKKFGLCFTNSCNNALELFNIHLELFKNNNTLPKPFLLLNSNKLDEYFKNYKLFGVDAELLELETFENYGGIAYIVKMYSMGYDNPKIDLLIFKDLFI